MRLSSISAFFPAYNEVENLPKMYASLSAVLPTIADDYEILIVDDGSSDGTGALADQLAERDPHVRPVHHPTNLGYGAAVAHGIEESRLDYIFFTDGDNQFDVSQIATLLPHIETNDAVIGFRIDRKDPAVRRFNAWAWKQLVSSMFDLRVTDIDCAFKLMRRSSLEGIELESTGAFISTELLVKLRKNRKSIHQVGVQHLPRTAGKQTGANLRVIARAFRELFRLRGKLRERGAVPGAGSF